MILYYNTFYFSLQFNFWEVEFLTCYQLRAFFERENLSGAETPQMGVSVKCLNFCKWFHRNWNFSSSCYVPLGVFGFSFLILIIACILTFFVFRSHVIGSREFNFLSTNKSYRIPNSCNLLLSLFVLQKK